MVPDEYDYDVFLSYNAASRAVVASIAEPLRDEHGLRVFFDAWETFAGDLVAACLRPSGRATLGSRNALEPTISQNATVLPVGAATNLLWACVPSCCVWSTTNSGTL
jgi:hypothetical protein